MKDGRGRPQGKYWETVVAAEQETCWWEMTNCRWVRCLQKKNGAGRNTPIQYSAWKKVGENSPEKKPAGGKSLETVIDEF